LDDGGLRAWHPAADGVADVVGCTPGTVAAAWAMAHGDGRARACGRAADDRCALADAYPGAGGPACRTGLPASALTAFPCEPRAALLRGFRVSIAAAAAPTDPRDRSRSCFYVLGVAGLSARAARAARSRSSFSRSLISRPRSTGR